MQVQKSAPKHRHFSEQAAENMKNHKYHGTDLGLLYVHVFSPGANKLVTYLPETLAPNTITAIGLACTVVPFIMLISIWGCNLVGWVPRWFVFFHSLTYFLYRFLDEMDGK